MNNITNLIEKWESDYNSQMSIVNEMSLYASAGFIHDKERSLSELKRMITELKQANETTSN